MRQCGHLDAIREVAPKTAGCEECLKAGTAWVNTYRLVNHAVPFGGWKASGYGVESGAESINEFTRTQVIWVETG